jgi:hypothetical protein
MTRNASLSILTATLLVAANIASNASRITSTTSISYVAYRKMVFGFGGGVDIAYT